MIEAPKLPRIGSKLVSGLSAVHRMGLGSSVTGGTVSCSGGADAVPDATGNELDAEPTIVLDMLATEVEFIEGAA
jgi:hypothetical protein